MKLIADAVGLGMVGLGPRVIDVLHRQAKPVGVVLPFSAILGPPVGQDTVQLYTPLIKHGGKRKIRPWTGSQPNTRQGTGPATQRILRQWVVPIAQFEDLIGVTRKLRAHRGT